MLKMLNFATKFNHMPMKKNISFIIVSMLCIILIGAYFIFAEPLKSLVSNESEWIDIGYIQSSTIYEDGSLHHNGYGTLEVRVINEQCFYRFNGNVVFKSNVNGFNARCGDNLYLNVPHY